MTSPPRATRLALLLALSALLAAAGGPGCVVVERTHLDSFTSGMDAGTDAGPRDPATGVDTCASPDVLVLADSTQLTIDTTTASNSFNSSCAMGGSSPGNDVFFAIDVAAGEFWHFHLQVDGSQPGAETRDPVIYLVQQNGPGSCDNRRCDNAQDLCDGNADEHFAFTAPADGLWYLGIDDRNAGGGHYILTAIKPVCMNGTVDHGEGCDPTATGAPANCNSSCRLTYDGSTTEGEPNDTVPEALVLNFGGGTEVPIAGVIGAGSCYPDIFQVSVSTGQTLSVAAFDATTDAACASTADAPFTLELLNAAGEVVTAVTEDANGCPVIQPSGALNGTYYLYVRPFPSMQDNVTRYKLRVTVST